MSRFHFGDVSWLPLVLLSITAVFLYYVTRTLYRLYFHPLARFPGPKLAAIGRWWALHATLPLCHPLILGRYEAYYEVVKVGMFSDQIQKMHEQYGMGLEENPAGIRLLRSL